ncbi:MAG TPA: NAD(P)H-dependent oxidoreductase [Myxococcales bacterium]|nr:NAD(P)H-dependent oxidoreductase [Myxococcales bacterium]
MPTILDVYALPRGLRSRTAKLRDSFLRGYLETHPGAVHYQLDLAKDYAQLPTLDEWDIEAKFEMMYGEGELDEEQAKRWNALSKLTDQMHSADLILISAPMWNFGIPWMLKRWIDSVAQCRLTWEVKDGQYSGLLQGRQAVVLATRDGAYSEGNGHPAWDFQLPYLRHILGFMGVAPVHAVVAEGLAPAGGQVRLSLLEPAMMQAEALARTL